MDFYNDQRYQLSKGFIKDVEYDLTQISWTTSVLNLALKNQEITQDKIGEKVISLYRPFFKQIGYYSRFWNERVYQLPKLFPTSKYKNLVICVKGIGDKDFSCLIADCIPDLQVIFNGQCFPLYWYEENKNKQQTLSLFDTESSDDYIRRDGITDWILKEVRTRFGLSLIHI